jgi:hypothetical protein
MLKKKQCSYGKYSKKYYRLKIKFLKIIIRQGLIYLLLKNSKKKKISEKIQKIIMKIRSILMA